MAAKTADKRKADAAIKVANKEAKKAEDETASKAVADAEVDEKKEKETDAKEDSRPQLKDTVGWDNADTTINVVPTTGGQVLMSLTEGGMQFLLAGARANVGVKAGRYMYEMKIVEALPPTETSQKVPRPMQLLRLGFSTAEAPLILGPGEGAEESVVFDSEGFFTAGTKKVQVQRFTREQVLAVLLNLDPKSPNANTVSLFRNGERVSEPMPIPENLHGKALFPHVTYRNVTLLMNFGPQSMKPLPFKCRMIQGAAKSDVTAVRSSLPKDGKYEVLFPIAFPDEGTFDWLDEFLKKNPQYVELSDRKLHEWAVKSGFWQQGRQWNPSNDKPEFKFGVNSMDDHSAQRLMNVAAAAVPRNYVVMEVKGNLLPTERAEALKRFGLPCYKRAARVVMGEPTEAFKKSVQDDVLKVKQEKSDAAWKQKKAEKERKKAVEARQKELVEQRKKKEEERKKAEEEKKKAEEEEKKKKLAEALDGLPLSKEEEKKKTEEAEAKEKEGKEKGEEGKDVEMKKVDEVKPEETKEDAKEEKKQEEVEEKKEDDDMETDPPQVELDEEDKKQWFRKRPIPDLTSAVLENNFARFTIPDKEEAFDSVKFEWQDDAKSRDYLRKWVLEKKMVSRMDSLQPSQWSKDKAAAFNTSIEEWQKKQKAFELKKREEGKKEGEDDIDDDKQVDIFSLEDICDTGGGEPLFAYFTFEDWAMLLLRHELHLLVHAFRKDANDPDRVGIHESNFMFYYQKYYNKTLNPKAYGVEKTQEVLDIIKDTMAISAAHVLTSSFEEELESPGIFAKLTEQCRRERQRRIDAGDETGRLKFDAMLLEQQRRPPMAQNQRQGGGGNRRNWKGGANDVPVGGGGQIITPGFVKGPKGGGFKGGGK